MKIDPNTASLNELRDWLAERKGWKYIPHFGQAGPVWEHAETHRLAMHPFPATLDAAAAAMPEGWRTYYIGFAIETVEANAMHIESGGMVRNTSATEILARFRLAALCILAEENAK